MTDYTQMACEACRAGAPPVSKEDLAAFLQSRDQWNHLVIDGEPRLRRIYAFKNFETALAFTNAVGALAEAEGHHPALLTEWGKVTVDWWTHKIHDIHLNDLILAARSDGLYDGMQVAD